MSHRGRGLLEVKPSSNPFFQTTNSDIGINVHEVKDTQWKVDGNTPVFHHSTHKVDGNFAFLYTRESDRIGSKVNKPVMKDVRVLTKTEFLKKKMEEYSSHNTDSHNEEESNESKDIPFKRTAEDVLKVYKHIPKYEDPRYTTSMSEYGKKAPSVATIVVDRAARPQGFSKSFQNIKPENTSLNTSITKSNVHSSLDPQFA